MAALLMAVDDPDGGPILVLAPKPLLQQWQDELRELLQLPSARWNGRAWVDENDLEYPSEGVKSVSATSDSDNAIDHTGYAQLIVDGTAKSSS